MMMDDIVYVLLRNIAESNGCCVHFNYDKGILNMTLVKKVDTDKYIINSIIHLAHLRFLNEIMVQELNKKIKEIDEAIHK